MTESQLDTLESKGLIRLVSIRPELEYLFRHWLVQDAAYGSLLKQERRDIHGRVGEALEELYPERRGELAAVLAMHFEQAGETEKAIEYYVDAGRYSLDRYAIQEAYAAFDHASKLLPPATATDDDASRHRRVEIELGRTQASWSFRSGEELLADLEAIVPEAERLADLDLASRVHLLLALGKLTTGATPSDPSVRRSLDRIAEIGATIGDPSLGAMPLALIGMFRVIAGPVRDGVTSLEEALPLLDRRKDSIGAAFARGALAMGYAALGEFALADEAARTAREVAEKGDLIAQLDAVLASSMVESAKGRLDEAVPLAQACVNRASETGASACVMASSWVLGDAYHRLGRYEDARAALEQSAAIALVVDRQVWRPTIQAALGSSAAALGDATDDEFGEALATAESIGNAYGAAGIRAKRGETLAARGDLEAASVDLSAAATEFEAEGTRPALARVLRIWGEALRRGGRSDEADPILRRALALFEEMGLAPEAAAVRKTLSVGSPIRYG